MTVRPYGLAPAGKFAADALAVLRLGDTVKVSITKDRSPAMNRFYWELVGTVAAGIGYDKDGLSEDLLIAARRVDSYVLSNGWTKIRPKRISRMDHYEFTAYVNDAIDIILRDYLPDMKRADLVAQVERMANVNYETAKTEQPKKGKPK